MVDIDVDIKDPRVVSDKRVSFNTDMSLKKKKNPRD